MDQIFTMKEIHSMNYKRSGLFKSGFVAAILAILALFLLIEVNSCQAQELKIVWEYPLATLAEDSTFFHVYVWQGTKLEMLNFDPSTIDSVGRRDFVPGLRDYVYPYTFDQNSVIRAALKAEDRLGRVSDTSWTEFYGYPERPENLRIIK